MMFKYITASLIFFVAHTTPTQAQKSFKVLAMKGLVLLKKSGEKVKPGHKILVNDEMILKSKEAFMILYSNKTGRVKFKVQSKLIPSRRARSEGSIILSKIFRPERKSATTQGFAEREDFPKNWKWKSKKDTLFYYTNKKE